VALALGVAPAQAQETSAATTTTTPTTTTTTTEPTDPASMNEPPLVRFKRGKSQFEYRDCNAAVLALKELAVPGQLADEADQLDVHRMLGICYALTDSAESKREAAREFSSLLSIDPDFQLDPFDVPPPVVDQFEAQKNAMKARLDEIRKARAKEGESFEDGGVLVERTTKVKVTPLPVVFVPFGFPQLDNGEIGKGVAFGTLQGVALAANVIGFWGTVAVQAGAKNDDFDAGEVFLERVFFVTQAVGLGALFVGYAAGVGDAWWNREEQAVLAEKQTKRPLTAAELKKLKRIERAPDPPPPPAAEPSTSTPTPD
jgi:hypothetical protein